MPGGACVISEPSGSWSRRFALAGKMMQRAFTDSITDLQLFTRTWKGGAILKQRRIHGFEVLVRADLDVGRQIYCHGQYEPEESCYLRQRIRSSDVCLDVGANVGYYTLLMSSAAANGTVHAFEPLPLTASLLRTNVLLNNIPNAVVSEMAIGDEHGEVDFVVSADDAYSSLLDTGRKPVLARKVVDMTTIDIYCQTQQLKRIDCLKVDVEGAEEKVIRGAARVLADHDRRPRLVMLELYNPMLTQFGSGIDKMLALMQSFGYQPFTIKRGLVAPFSRTDYDICYNVFFSPGESLTPVGALI
jgi:FkbM family methyltransferase